MAIIDEFKFEDGRQAIEALHDDHGDVAQAYFSGDHWQNGDAWIGPRPISAEDPAGDLLAEIERMLVSRNIISEVVGRHCDALIGREADWSMTVRRELKKGEGPSDEEKDLIKQAEADLTGWWDEKQALTYIQEACANLLVSSSPGRAGAKNAISPGQASGVEESRRAHSCLRLFVPPALVTKDGDIPLQKDVAAALKILHVHAPDTTQSTVYTDPDSQERLGLFTYQHQEGTADASEQRLEVHGLDAQGRTIIRIINEGEILQESKPLEMGGHLGIFEMRRKRFITPQVSQLQAAANVALTMMENNVVLGGFLERVFLNVQPPGHWEKDETTGKRTFIRDPLYVGAGSSNFFTGTPIYDDPARPGVITGYATPSVNYREPVKVDTFTNTFAAAYGSILDEVSQRHVLMSSDATASGESRRQAAAAFLTSLLPTKAQIEAMGRWLLETALAMAGQFAGTPGRYRGLRAVFQCRIDAGPVPVEVEDQTIKLKEAHIISTETAMMRVGVDDVDSELAKIEATQEAERELQQQEFDRQMALKQQQPPEDQTKGAGAGT